MNETVRATSSSLTTTHDTTKPPTSRLFPTPRSPSEVSTATNRVSDAPSIASSIQFNPPPGSRLLAFGTRMSSTHINKPHSSPGIPAGSHTSAIPIVHQNPHQQSPLSDHPLNGDSSMQSPTGTSTNQLIGSVESIRHQQMFAPFEDSSRQTLPLEGARETKSMAQQPESIRRPTELNMYPELGPHHDPAPFSTGLSQSTLDSANGPTAFASSKGSRFAKFFDGKTRDAPATTKSQSLVGQQSPSPVPSHRHDMNFSGNNENRAMEDIFAMLNNSSQVCLEPLSTY